MPRFPEGRTRHRHCLQNQLSRMALVSHPFAPLFMNRISCTRRLVSRPLNRSAPPQYEQEEGAGYRYYSLYWQLWADSRILPTRFLDDLAGSHVNSGSLVVPVGCFVDGFECWKCGTIPVNEMKARKGVDLVNIHQVHASSLLVGRAIVRKCSQVLAEKPKRLAVRNIVGDQGLPDRSPARTLPLKAATNGIRAK